MRSKSPAGYTKPGKAPAAASSETAQATIGGAVAAAETLPPGEAEALVAAARDAFTAGMQLTAGISVLGLLATAALAAVLIGRARSGPAREED